LFVFPGCGPADDPNMKEKGALGLKYHDVQEGKGEEAKRGDLLVVHYTGRLRNGKVFDSSHNRGDPFIFKLGAGEVIRGWDQGVVGMKVGGMRKLIIPSELGYGERAQGGIPANSELRFEIDLVENKSLDSTPKEEKKDDKDK